MQYRTIPKTGDRISAVGYGCMRLPTRAGRIDEAKAEAQMLYALDQGINYFDTALPYHNGESEKVLGRIFEKNKLRDKVKFATKLPPFRVKTREDMDRILDGQLKSLRTSYIDYYLVHGIQSQEEWDRMLGLGILDFLTEAKASGKIRNVGFSYHADRNSFKGIIDAYDWEFCQIQYSYLDENNQAGKAGLEYAASKDIAVFIMEPLRGGMLVGKLPKKVQEIYDKEGRRSAADWAFSWVLNHREVTCVLSGMNVDAHIKENIEIAKKALPGSMPEKDMAVIERVKNQFETMMKVPCTGCAYCMPCPAGVNIPACFEQLNNKSYFGLLMAKGMYIMQTGGLMSESTAKASQCINCGKCEKHCPQHIEIRKELKQVSKELESFYDPALIWVAKRVMRGKN